MDAKDLTAEKLYEFLKKNNAEKAPIELLYQDNFIPFELTKEHIHIEYINYDKNKPRVLIYL